MKIYTYEDPDRYIVKVAFIAGEGNEFRTAFNFATDTVYTLKPGDAFPPGCFMKIPRNLWEEMLKEFAELANNKGLKLESDLKREGKLEAVQDHLEDMRRIVFKDFESKQ